MNNSLRRLLPFFVAARAIFITSIFVLLFHLLVLLGLIPFDIVWGGKLQGKNEMLVFETVSVLINLLLIWMVYKKWKHREASNTAVNVVLWIFVIIFALNTAGNLTAEKRIEMLLATPLTFILAVLCWRVAIEKPSTEVLDGNFTS